MLDNGARLFEENTDRVKAIISLLKGFTVTEGIDLLEEIADRLPDLCVVKPSFAYEEDSEHQSTD